MSPCSSAFGALSLQRRYRPIGQPASDAIAGALWHSASWPAEVDAGRPT